jgi:WS/DGAT/MGAT family acyltransferase
MALMSLQDAVFLLPENREQPMHVGGLQLFQRPEGAGKDFLNDMHAELVAVDEVAPIFRRRAYRSISTLGQWAWEDDTDLDLEHHVRHSALPRPGRIRELLALTSRLHSTLLDRRRPLWEMHLIEGLQDGRFAIYFKLHHAVMDGVHGLRLMQKSLKTDPDDLGLCAPYLPRVTASQGGGGFSPMALPGMLAGAAKDVVSDVVSFAPAVLQTAERLVREQAAALPAVAPRTILNGPITGSRRFAAQSWPLERLRNVARDAGVTLNDVVLAMCSGALREYLDEQGELPDAPLLAMVPVSLALRSDGPESTHGNNIGAIIANLATDEPDPARRLDAISASVLEGKQRLAGMSRIAVLASSGIAMAPIAMSAFFGINRLMPPPFNLVISNVPGPKQPLWMQGARLDAFYPLSIPSGGQALNITVTSYVDSMEFGLTGCRRHVPHLQRLLTHLETSLADLEKAYAA